MTQHDCGVLGEASGQDNSPVLGTNRELLFGGFILTRPEVRHLPNVGLGEPHYYRARVTFVTGATVDIQPDAD
ncbi:MAG: hypothetical protein DWH84_02070 [Planctomycetota bacterium]|nr:MAG: hypothetical protein DWH84_02070 [Planctomycetota bacterium]